MSTFWCHKSSNSPKSKAWITRQARVKLSWVEDLPKLNHLCSYLPLQVVKIFLFWSFSTLYEITLSFYLTPLGCYTSLLLVFEANFLNFISFILDRCCADAPARLGPRWRIWHVCAVKEKHIWWSKRKVSAEMRRISSLSWQFLT